MTVVKCFYTIAFYLFSLNTGALLIVVVGLDRLLAITIPMR